MSIVYCNVHSETLIRRRNFMKLCLWFSVHGNYSLIESTKVTEAKHSIDIIVTGISDTMHAKYNRLESHAMHVQ